MRAEASHGLKLSPERSLWEERLKDILHRGSADPCHSDIMATSYARYFGFGSRVNSFADELLVAMYFGYSFSLCDSAKDKFISRVWAPHFDNASGFPVCASKKRACKHGDMWDSLHMGDELAHNLTSVSREYLDDLKHFIYPRIFQYNRRTQEQVDARLVAAGMSPGDAFVAVHVRRGDKVTKGEAQMVDSAAYADASRPFLRMAVGSASLLKAIQRQLRSIGASVVYVSSDDSRAAPEIQTALGHRVRVLEQRREAAEGYESRGYEREEDLIAVLTDLEALRRADVFIGTASSNVGRLAYYLRPRGSVSISLDDNGDWLKRQV